MRNLAAEYLKDVGDKSLTGEVSRIAASKPEIAFAYRYALTPPTIPGAVPPPKAAALHRVWNDVRF
jgi:hypothetical protein